MRAMSKAVMMQTQSARDLEKAGKVTKGALDALFLLKTSFEDLEADRESL